MMRVVRRHRLIALGLVGALLAAGGSVARAQSASPSAAPRIDGAVTGGLAAGGTLDVRADVTMVGGWQGLDLISVVVESGGRELERMVYDVDRSRVEIGDGDVLVGTGDEWAGTYLRVRGPRVIVTTGGPYMTIQIHADVLRTLPQTARFRLSATDDGGATVEVTRAFAVPDEGGFGWDVVLAAVLGALLVGAFAGNLVASRRKLPPKLSVYGAIQRRLDSEPPATRTGR